MGQLSCGYYQRATPKITEPTWVGSPNFSTRQGYKPSSVVIHIGEGYEAGFDAWFNDPESEVSAHFAVMKDGRIKQYVEVKHAAWHAGVWWWNKRSVGIENEGFTGEPWPKAQVDSNIYLLRMLWRDCGIEPARNFFPIKLNSILRHSEVNPAKPHCPGTGCPFDFIMKEARRLGPLW